MFKKRKLGNKYDPINLRAYNYDVCFESEESLMKKANEKFTDLLPMPPLEGNEE